MFNIPETRPSWRRNSMSSFSATSSSRSDSNHNNGHHSSANGQARPVELVRRSILIPPMKDAEQVVMSTGAIKLKPRDPPREKPLSPPRPLPASSSSYRVHVAPEAVKRKMQSVPVENQKTQRLTGQNRGSFVASNASNAKRGPGHQVQAKTVNQQAMPPIATKKRLRRRYKLDSDKNHELSEDEEDEEGDSCDWKDNCSAISAIREDDCRVESSTR